MPGSGRSASRFGESSRGGLGWCRPRGRAGTPSLVVPRPRRPPGPPRCPSGAQPSCGDQRYGVVDLRLNELKKGEKPEVTGMGVVGAAPMSTRLDTLHDEDVHAGFLGELDLL